MVKELSKKICYNEQQLQTSKSPLISPQSSPRSKYIYERTNSLNTLVNILTKLTTEPDEEGVNSPKKKLSGGEKHIQTKSNPESRASFEQERETSKTEPDSEVDNEASERSFVVMVSTYNDDELCAQSISDDQESSSSDSDYQQIKRILNHIYGDEIHDDEERTEVKKMLKVVVLGEEEQ